MDILTVLMGIFQKRRCSSGLFAFMDGPCGAHGDNGQNNAFDGFSYTTHFLDRYS